MNVKHDIYRSIQISYRNDMLHCEDQIKQIIKHLNLLFISFDGIDNITANDGIWFKILTCTQLEQRLAFVVENFRKDFLIAYTKALPIMPMISIVCNLVLSIISIQQMAYRFGILIVTTYTYFYEAILCSHKFMHDPELS